MRFSHERLETSPIPSHGIAISYEGGYLTFSVGLGKTIHDFTLRFF